jgi:wyosine [tRNA(Phe)-imidazoG37] synthetase (radical SAM superfamily)
MTTPALVFGPVPSRRLGRSLGINNIPPKTCSYSCVYCQLGRTDRLILERQAFHAPAAIAAAAGEAVAGCVARGEAPDYVTIVAEGEPTLDGRLGRAIEALKPLGIRIAVVSNTSLVTRGDVQEELALADWVSLKLDAVSEDVWRRLNRPHGQLRLGPILAGMLAFSRRYRGRLATETMLVQGVNDGDAHLRGIACFLERLAPDEVYLSVPTRPPAEPWVRAPGEAVLTRALQILRGRLPGTRLELLLSDQDDAFGSGGDAAHDLLSITAVHPMREEAVAALLRRTGTAWALVEDLLAEGRLARVEHAGATYYLRRLRRPGTARSAGERGDRGA